MGGIQLDDDNSLWFEASLKARILKGIREDVNQAYHAGFLTYTQFATMNGVLIEAGI